MRVAFDATPLITGEGGTARYVRELGRALRAQGVDLLPYALGRASFPPPDGTRWVPIPLQILHRGWSLLGWPTAERLVPGADLVHVTGLVAPPSRLPTVVTIHDLAALDRPDLHPPRAVRQLRAQLRALDQVQVVLTVSHAAAADLQRHGVPADKIIVTANGLTPLPSGRDTGMPPGYLLAVGDMSPRKNLGTLLEAFRRANLPGRRLVLVGPGADHGRDLMAEAERLGVADRVQVMGPVDDALLAGLYRDAAALCFPSVAEGFGLPVLEALGAGLPVVASDLPVLREIGGDLPRFVPPTDVSAWSSALERVMVDDDLRTRVRTAGPVQAARYAWSATATSTVQAYRKARDDWAASSR
jgi:glycosyltransferase involved in cell wall biosynthesis